MTNYWLQKSQRRQVFNRLKKCELCLFNDQDESDKLPVKLEAIWSFQYAFWWTGYRIYEGGNCIKEERFPSPFEHPSGGTITITTEPLMVDYMFTVGELFNEFEPDA